MKNSATSGQTHSKATGASNRPDNKQTLDSRKNEEQRLQGDNRTHNSKEVHSSTKNDRKKP
ncbi:hypothetical protein [Sediminibacterium ginsengisoli]|uniref:Uncharacterized protein n=1 Tax=Sediminibacterium ginsengisoli TaxID=413434 RepID=A0A1T4N6N5_9BACT|nr:hypothetical protein [Sediminibacterium ginsengisoli]SJZ74766.1 hypothetical protein SAMN04488132_104114 [Sediminibacterium ginsengisoli]